MPVSIVIGGQFGSEGKGKVALEITRQSRAPVTVIRVGGPNSGHTGYDLTGQKHALRQLPAACVDRNVDVVLPSGSYIDTDIFLKEIEDLEYPKNRIRISEFARIIRPEHREWEKKAGLTNSIGSTGSGVGGAVMAAVAREAKNFDVVSHSVMEDPRLHRYIDEDLPYSLQIASQRGVRFVVEGTQGFGLSLLEGGYWPKATSRSTTAASALAESGLSPVDVDDVTMVVRSFPIRVAGDSGFLAGETTWKEISEIAGRSICEFTTVTGRVRRVGHFDHDLVRRALAVNRPTRLVLNHMDYIGQQGDLEDSQSNLSKFLRTTEMKIGREFDWLGFSHLGCIERVCNPA